MLSFLNTSNEDLIDNVFFFLHNIISDPENDIKFYEKELLVDNLLKSLNICFDKISININGA